MQKLEAASHHLFDLDNGASHLSIRHDVRYMESLLLLETMHALACCNGTHATLYSRLHHVSVLLWRFSVSRKCKDSSGCIMRKYTMECLS